MENKLIKTNKNNFIYNIKQFFSKYFYKNASNTINSNGKSSRHEVNSDLVKSVRNIESDEIIE